MNKKYKIGLLIVATLVVLGFLVNSIINKPNTIMATKENETVDGVPLSNEENIIDIAFNYLSEDIQNLIQKEETKLTVLEANDYESFYSLDSNWDTFFIQGKKIYLVEFFKDGMSEPNNVPVVIDFETLEVLGMPLVE